MKKILITILLSFFILVSHAQYFCKVQDNRGDTFDVKILNAYGLSFFHDTAIALFPYHAIINSKMNANDTVPNGSTMTKYSANNSIAAINSNFSNYYTKVQSDSLYQPKGNYVNQSTTLTINGTTQSLTANRAFNVGTIVGGDTANQRSYSNALYQSKGSYITPTDTLNSRNYSNNLYQSKGTYLQPSDTTSLSNRINAKQASGNYLLGNDTVSLSNRINANTSLINGNTTAINARVKYSDTAMMLAGYGTAIGLRVRYSDTAAMLAPYQTAINTNTTTIATKLSSSTAASTYEPIVTASNTVKKYYNGYKQFVGLNSDSTTEGSTNLYFTNARARTAISLTTTGTSGAATYSSSTGVINIPIYAVNSGTVTSVTATSPLTGGTITTSGSIGIPFSKADNATTGASGFDSIYFKDNSSGIIKYFPTHGTGTVSGGAVTINEPAGKIQVASPSILANATLSVTFTNSLITPTSIINVGVNGNGSTLSIGLNCSIKSQTNGSCVINVLNLSLLSVFSTAFIIDYYITP